MRKTIDARELRWMLKRMGYTQTEFADFIGKSRQFVSALCASHEAVPLRYVNSLIEMVGEELFVIAQIEWYKKEQDINRRRVEYWIFYPDKEEQLPPEARANAEALRYRVSLVKQYYEGALGATNEIQRERAKEYIEKAKHH